MATQNLHIYVETDLLDDALHEIQFAHRALAKRHGEHFRALDRRIDAFFDYVSADGWLPDIYADIDGIHAVLVPPPQMRELIDEAKRLGVL